MSIGRIREFALLIPVVAAETGSQLTAHTATSRIVSPATSVTERTHDIGDTSCRAGCRGVDDHFSQ